MTHTELIEEFYTSFANGDPSRMTQCYHKDITFKDPAFGTLTGSEAIHMWHMLLNGTKQQIKISFNNIKASHTQGHANWVAEYTYGPKNSVVINHISAEFTFKDGKIYTHTDTFNLWKWTQQAMGLTGFILGWTPFMRKKIQHTLQRKLAKYIKTQSQ